MLCSLASHDLRCINAFSVLWRLFSEKILRTMALKSLKELHLVFFFPEPTYKRKSFLFLCLNGEKMSSAKLDSLFAFITLWVRVLVIKNPSWVIRNPQVSKVKQTNKPNKQKNPTPWVYWKSVWLFILKKKLGRNYKPQGY